MNSYIITQPTIEPLTLAEAKLHCRIDSDDTARDTLITALIQAARERAEHLTGRNFLTQTWEAQLDKFPDAIALDRPPFQSVTYVKYLDLNGALQTLSTASYSADLNGLRAYIVPAYSLQWPETYKDINAVTVRWASGYTSAALVPESVKQYMRLVISDFNEHSTATVAGTKLQLEPHPFLERLLDRVKVQIYA